MLRKKHDDNSNPHKEQSDDLELVLLKTINNEFELNLIKGLLDENEIPYIVKDYGVGGYMRIIAGTSFYRTDILVEKSQLEKAKDIIEQFNFNEDESI